MRCLACDVNNNVLFMQRRGDAEIPPINLSLRSFTSRHEVTFESVLGDGEGIYLTTCLLACLSETSCSALTDPHSVRPVM